MFLIFLNLMIKNHTLHLDNKLFKKINKVVLLTPYRAGRMGDHPHRHCDEAEAGGRAIWGCVRSDVEAIQRHGSGQDIEGEAGIS